MTEEEKEECLRKRDEALNASEEVESHFRNLKSQIEKREL